MKDFSKKTLNALARKRIQISGSTSVPGFEGDKYFSGVAYNLVWNGIGFIRTHSQVITLALSSWNPEDFFNQSNNQK